MKVKERVKITHAKDIRFSEVLKRGVWFLISFVLSFSSVVNGSCPFAVSLISVSSKKNFLFSTLGAGLGYIIFCDSNSAIRYFSAVLICSLGTFAVNIFNSRREAYLPMLVSFLSVFTTGIVMNLKTGAAPAAYALVLGEVRQYLLLVAVFSFTGRFTAI